MKVSVIVPAYNSSGFIKSCLSNLDKQTFTDYEVIFVVDSKSNDDTFDLISSLTENKENVRVILQEGKGGLGEARNIGLDAANGDYIVFYDIDDNINENYILDLYNIIEKENSDVVISNIYYSNSQSGVKIPEKNYSVISMSGTDALLALNKGKIPCNAWGKIISLSFLKENNIKFAIGFCEDYQFNIDVFMCVKKVSYYNKPLYAYRLRKDSMSYMKGNEIVKKDIEIFTKTSATIKEKYPDKYEEFCRASLSHILSGLTQTDKKTYETLVKCPIIQESSKYKGKFDIKIFVFKISKKLFYFIGTRARKKKFSHDTILFDKNI